MDPLTLIIIDDERNCIGALEILMQRLFPEIQIVATCENGQEGITAIEKYKPDFILLDISMPGMNGFEMLSKIENPGFKIIFTTAYDQYAIKAFKVSAIDYLLKPIDHVELKVAIDKMKDELAGRDNKVTPQFIKSQFDLFLENINARVNALPNIAFPTMEGMQMIKAENINYVEADGNYSRCHFLDQSNLLVTKSLKQIDEQLEKYSFIRVHRSYLLNLNHLDKYFRGEGGYVVMNNGVSIQVSRRNKDQLLRRLNM